MNGFRLAAWVACLLLPAAMVKAGPDEVALRVHLAPGASDSDVLRVRDAITSAGGSVRGYAAGDVFVARMPAPALARIAGLPAVARVVPLALPEPSARSAAAQPGADQRLASMPKACTPSPTAAQAARTARLARAAPAVASSALSRRRALLAGVAALPPLVDNSLSHHFPPIGDQEGRSSCVAWAAGYYWSTYTQAMDEGLDVSGTWLPRDPPCDILTDGVFDPVKFQACLPTLKDPPRPSRATEHIGSPAFLYPLIHVAGTDASGNLTDDAGAFMIDAMVGLATWGVGSWQMKPYDPWRYDDVVLGWPNQGQWVEALPRRTTADIFSFRMGFTGELDKLKQHLANGHLAVAAFEQHQNVMLWGWDRSCQASGRCPGMDSDVLYSHAGSPLSGGHAVTIVGYDDERAYVDASTGQPGRGALLIANSASPVWGVPNTSGAGGNGYFWMAYRYAEANLRDVMYNGDRPHYRPRLYVSADLAGGRRNEGSLFAGIGFQGMLFDAPYAKFMTGNHLPLPREAGPRPFEPGKRLVVDLSDGLPQIDLAGPVPLLFVAYLGGGTPTTLGQARFHLDRFGNGSFATIASPDPARTEPIGPTMACTDVAQNGDVKGDGGVDRTDIVVITSTLRWPPQCLSDPRDMDRDGRITILDARKAMLRCTQIGCAPK